MLFWAKLGDGTYPDDAHPVICHLLDVGSVALELWEHGLHAGFRTWLADPLNMADDEAGRWAAFAIAMHDIGKVSPPFQRKSDAAVLKLSDAGFRFPPATKPAAAHGVVSAGVLPSLWQSEFGVPESFAGKLAHAIGGHHGLFAEPGTAAMANDDPRQVGDATWTHARHAIMTRLADAMGVKRSRKWPEQTPDAAWLMAVAGLTSVADWIGSMQHFFPSVGTGVNWGEYIVEARDRGRKAVTELGWNGWQPAAQSRSLSELFPFITAGNERPLQRAASRLTAQLPEPTLVVIEAPMGEGRRKQRCCWPIIGGDVPAAWLLFRVTDNGDEQPDVWKSPGTPRPAISGRPRQSASAPRARLAFGGFGRIDPKCRGVANVTDCE